jgi:RNA polymerase sigma-70 factor (ECF subfamily)
VESVEGARRFDACIRADVSDSSGFAEWVRPHWGEMYGLAVRMCGPNECDDVLQDAVASAWRKWATFDPARGSARGWLLAVVADQARKARRRARRRHWGELTDDVPIPDGAAPDRLDLAAAVRRLPERQRLAIDLFYFLDLPIDEIAGVMSCSTGTVKSTLHDARRRLQNLLGADYR